jgi:hypothetical protein
MQKKKCNSVIFQICSLTYLHIIKESIALCLQLVQSLQNWIELVCVRHRTTNDRISHRMNCE